MKIQKERVAGLGVWSEAEKAGELLGAESGAKM